METKQTFALRIERMRDGGYVVLQTNASPPNEDRFAFFGPLFAATTIKEALDYIKARLEPTSAKVAK